MIEGAEWIGRGGGEEEEEEDDADELGGCGHPQTRVAVAVADELGVVIFYKVFQKFNIRYHTILVS